jgi:hypothetical protein
MISEIIEKAAELKTKKEKVDFLRQNDSSALRTVLKYTADPQIKFLLPDSDPPFKLSEAKESQGMLYSEARRLYLFVEGGNPNLTPFKREMLFVQLLEAVDPKDAQLLLQVKNKKLPKGLDKKLIQEAFEGLL